MQTVNQGRVTVVCCHVFLLVMLYEICEIYEGKSLQRGWLSCYATVKYDKWGDPRDCCDD